MTYDIQIFIALDLVLLAALAVKSIAERFRHSPLPVVQPLDEYVVEPLVKSGIRLKHFPARQLPQPHRVFRKTAPVIQTVPPRSVLTTWIFGKRAEA
jgi:hypothetical protein